MIQIKIPVPNYLKKYLLTLYGDNYQATLNDELGILVINCLQKKTYYNYKLDMRSATTFFPVNISFSQLDKDGCIISERKIIEIYKTLDYNFRLSMYRSAILNKENFGIEYKKTVLAHLRTFGITEDEMSYSSIRKDFNRRKGGIAIKMLKSII